MVWNDALGEKKKNEKISQNSGFTTGLFMSEENQLHQTRLICIITHIKYAMYPTRTEKQ